MKWCSRQSLPGQFQSQISRTEVSGVLSVLWAWREELTKLRPGYIAVTIGISISTNSIDKLLEKHSDRAQFHWQNRK